MFVFKVEAALVAPRWELLFFDAGHADEDRFVLFARIRPYGAARRAFVSVFVALNANTSAHANA